MKGLRKYLTPFAPDQSGAVSVLYELGGMLVICDAGGCTGNVCGFDEPRWFETRSAVFSAGLRDMDAILGRDDRLVAKLADAAEKLDVTFAAVIGTPVPAVIGTDYRALERMLARADRTAGPPEQIVQVLERECRAIHREDGEMCRRIAEHGLTLVGEGDGILTHCNAGALAASRYGTALGPILLGQERGKKLRVFADETRPLLQGARLTAWELARAGVEVTLICDNMASMVMKNGWVQACFVGCDRVAANGDTANKIGTSGLAVLARYYNVPFYVLGPTSTIDLDCPTGADIPIEERDGEEIRSLWYQEPMAPAGVRCWDPAFDVTDHSLISAIVTEGGICRPPFGESLRELVSREKGDAP